jgi:hypothetical protein
MWHFRDEGLSTGVLLGWSESFWGGVSDNSNAKRHWNQDRVPLR